MSEEKDLIIDSYNCITAYLNSTGSGAYLNAQADLIRLERKLKEYIDKKPTPSISNYEFPGL